MVTSSAGDATLSVADPSPTATGRLTNGTFALATPVMARANQGVFAPITGTNTPLTLLTYAGPVSANAVTIGLKQTIGAERVPAHRHVQQDADVLVVDDDALIALTPAPRHDAAGPVACSVSSSGSRM